MEYIPLCILVTSSITKSGFQDCFIDSRSFHYWDLQQTECIEKLIQFFTVLSEKKQSIVSRKQLVVFLQQFNIMWFSSIDWERFKTEVIVHFEKEVNRESIVKKAKTRNVLSFYEVPLMSHFCDQECFFWPLK